MISLKAHNILDYVIGALLIVSPWIFGFNEIGTARNVYLLLGVGLIVYSSITNYYYSLAKVLPLGVHMTFDALAGIVLILSPALFGYRELLTDGQYAAHIVFGIGAVGLVALTRPRTEAAKTPAERAAINHDVPLPHS